MIRIAKFAILGFATSASVAYAAAPAGVIALCGAACMTACATLGIDCGMADCAM